MMFLGVFTLTRVRTGKVLGEFTCRVHSLARCVTEKVHLVKLLVLELSMGSCVCFLFGLASSGSNAPKRFVKSEDEYIGTQND